MGVVEYFHFCCVGLPEGISIDLPYGNIVLLTHFSVDILEKCLKALHHVTQNIRVVRLYARTHTNLSNSCTCFSTDFKEQRYFMCF